MNGRWASGVSRHGYLHDHFACVYMKRLTGVDMELAGSTGTQSERRRAGENSSSGEVQYQRKLVL